MRAKTIESLKAESAVIVGMSKAPDGYLREYTQSIVEASMFYGYYRGCGHSSKGAAFLAQKAIKKGNA